VKSFKNFVNLALGWLLIPGRHAVTGAFGYSGKYIARELLDRGMDVRTLTNHPDNPHEFRDRVRAFPYNFDDHDALVESLSGATVFINNYWRRNFIF